jgi:hypothetical protein
VPVPTPLPDPGAAPAFSLGTGPNVIVEVFPQPLLLTAVAPPELPPDPELELPLAPESPVRADPLLDPESVEMPELDVEPPPEVPELDAPPPLELPEVDALPEEDAAASLPGGLSPVELLLPHALATATRHARNPVSGEWVVTSSLSIGVYDSRARVLGDLLPARDAPRHRFGPQPAVAPGRPIRHSGAGRSAPDTPGWETSGTAIAPYLHSSARSVAQAACDPWTAARCIRRMTDWRLRRHCQGGLA